MLRQFATFVSSNLVRHQEATRSKSSAIYRWIRPLSSASPKFDKSKKDEDGVPRIEIETPDGRKFSLLDSRRLPKLKPSIVRRRLNRLKIFSGKERDIRHSPWRLNLICEMITGLPVPEAFLQLQFCEKSRAPLVAKVLKRVVLEAEKESNLQPSQLEVAECFSTKGTHLKRIKPMGRGRSGQMTRPYSHMRLVLREIDFKLRIFQQKKVADKKKWLMLQLEAEKDAASVSTEAAELEMLEAKQREIEEREKADKQ